MEKTKTRKEKKNETRLQWQGAKGTGMGTGLVTIRPKQLEGKQGEELPEQSATGRASRKERGRLFEASGAFCVWACMG